MRLFHHCSRPVLVSCRHPVVSDFGLTHLDRSMGENFTTHGLRWWSVLPGPIGVLSVTMNVYLPPKIGLTTTFVFQIAGNMCAGLVLDSVGAFGVPTRPITVNSDPLDSPPPRRRRRPRLPPLTTTTTTPTIH